MIDVKMPRLSDSMEEGTILSWLKADGDLVTAGEDLVEIETDKAAMTHAAEADGVLAIVVWEGETVRVGGVIARIGASVPARGEEREPEPDPHPEPAVPAAAANGPSPAVLATPLARLLAREHDVDLEDMIGSGPRGRILKTDVATRAGIALAEPPAPAPAPPGRAPDSGSGTRADSAKGPTTIVELSRLQKTIARRMSEAKATVPEFQIQTDVAMDAAVDLRARLKELGADPLPSFNDLIVKAAALALRDHPRANASYKDGRFELHGRINVGIAVAADDALVVPTIFDADTRSLGSLAAESRRLAERVRAGTITPPELSGGTFTISNLGMYGMTAIAPVINLPQAAILGVGALREGKLMTLTLTCDHRILYGADAAQFLAAVRQNLETPVAIAF